MSGVYYVSKSMMRPRYRLHLRNRKYYINSSSNPLGKDHYLIKGGWHKIITHKSYKFYKKYAKRVTAGPGTYGIFLKNNRSNLGIGECLYVGQSSNVKNRVTSHLENLKEAEQQIKNNRGEIPLYEEMTMQTMYYKVMAEHSIKDLKFMKLSSVEKKKWNKMSKHDAFELLTFLEQWSIDCWKPKYNIVAARMTRI